MRGFSLSIFLLLLNAVPIYSQTLGTPTGKTGLSAASDNKRIGLVDEIVAVVNQDVITRNELDNQLRLACRQLEQNNVRQPTTDALERQVLEQMIVERLQLQQARETAIRIDDLQLDRAISVIAAQNKLSLQAMRDRLEADGIPFATFRENIRQEILLSRLRDREVNNRVQVSDAEIEAFLAAQSGGNIDRDQTELNIAQILLRLPENASPEQIDAVRTRATQIFNELRAGADFAATAATQSNAPDALKGGELGWRTQDRLPQLFVDAVVSLKPGEIAAPVKSANGFHILKLIARRSNNPQLAKLAGPPVEQTLARHILIRVNELVSQQEAQRRLRDIKQRLDNKAADFATLARQYSVDGSAAKGGDLGWVYPGDTVPEFEKVMNTLKPGEISEPVETPFGWHLIQVLERRTQGASAERQRVAVREAVREQKADAAYQEWLRQLRENAFVEIRLGER